MRGKSKKGEPAGRVYFPLPDLSRKIERDSARKVGLERVAICSHNLQSGPLTFCSADLHESISVHLHHVWLVGSRQGAMVISLWFDELDCDWSILN